jgi:small-conductance mechanosensitive channel
MFEEGEKMETTTEGTPRWMGMAVVGLAILSVTGIGMAWNASSHANNAEQELKAEAKTFQTGEDGLTQRLTQSEQANAQMQGELNLVTSKLKLTQDQLATARKQVTATRADYTKKLDEVQTTLATKASADDVKALGTDVSGVKTDLDTTKGNLQQLRGEHGELIARNHEELEQLKRMGERDYFEFTLEGKGKSTHAGSVLVELRGVNAKRHQYTVALTIDDIRHDEKSKAINEPIYFYSGGSRAASELVVNQVSAKKISGYISSPKTAAASAAATAAKAN